MSTSAPASTSRGSPTRPRDPRPPSTPRVRHREAVCRWACAAWHLVWDYLRAVMRKALGDADFLVPCTGSVELEVARAAQQCCAAALADPALVQHRISSTFWIVERRSDPMAVRPRSSALSALDTPPFGGDGRSCLARIRCAVRASARANESSCFCPTESVRRLLNFGLVSAGNDW